MQMSEKGFRVVIGGGVCATCLCQYRRVSVYTDLTEGVKRSDR